VRSIITSRLFLRFILPLTVGILITGAASAATLSDYQSRVKQAVSALDTLAQSDENESPEAYVNRVNETVARVRSILPETETISWEGEELPINNRWLHTELEQFAKASQPDAPLILKRITERLQAIDDRMTEGVAEVKVTKGDLTGRLDEILKRPEYLRKVEQESALSRLWKDFIRWLQELFPKRPQLSPGRANLFTLLAQIFVVLLAVGVILYIARMFLPRFIAGRRRERKARVEPRIVLGEKLEPEKSAGDLLFEAEALARRGDLRAAIRKCYIALLVELGERKLISLAQHKTNRDYLRALRNTEPLYSNMRGLTESFEQHWYGFASASEADWLAFRDGYKRALSR